MEGKRKSDKVCRVDEVVKNEGDKQEGESQTDKSRDLEKTKKTLPEDFKFAQGI